MAEDNSSNDLPSPSEKGEESFDPSQAILNKQKRKEKEKEEELQPIELPSTHEVQEGMYAGG